MSRAYTPTSKVNPCPICDDTSGKCRTKDDGGKEFILCMNFGDSKFGELVNGYKCIKEASPNKSYFACTWIIDNSAEWTEQQRAEWERRKQEKKDHQAREMAEKKRRSLSPVERDKGYREIFAQLELHPDDREDLKRRGFTDKQIELSGFKSVQPHQFLKTGVNPNLPGVTKNGKELVVKADGYLIPVKNVDGLITGCQIRLRTPIDGNRYLWLSSQNVLHLFPDGSTQGELPLAVHRPQGKPSGLALVEGTGAKPFLVANRLNALVIGAAGGQFPSSRNLWRDALEKLSAEVGSKEIAIPPDAGDILNPSVMNRWKGVTNQLIEWGYKPVIKWWNQVTKNDSDIDELLDYSQIKDITADEFFALQSQSEIKQLIRNEEAWELWRKVKQFTGDININTRYISDAIELPQSGQCTAINSGLGSGKTTLFYKLVQAYPDKGFLAFGARNNLLRQTAGEAGFYHLQDDLKGDEAGMLLLADPLSKIICCIDSIIHFYPEYFDGKILILDEFESTFKQLLLANTAVSQWRQRACYLLIEALKRCDRVVILDGNLKDSTIASLEEIFANHGIDKKITKIKNLDNSLTSNRVRFYVGANQGDEILLNNRSVFNKYVLETAEDAPFTVVSDSQIYLEGLEKDLIANGLKGLRIDSTTTDKPEVAIFLKNADAPKHWILENKPDYLLLSPSLENGGNINIPGYFKNIFGYFCGVLLTDEQLQILRRVRDSEALIHIFCKPVGLSSNSVSSSPFPHEIEHTLKEFVTDCANASFEGLDFKEALTKMIESVTQTASQSEFFKYECKLRAIANHERFNLRECLHEALINRGYKVEPFSEEKTDDPIKNLESEVKDKNSKAIAESEIVSTEKAEEINRNPRATQEEKFKAKKRRYLDRLPGIEKVEIEGKPLFDASFVRLVEYDDRRLIGKLETLHFLQNADQAKLIQQNRWHKVLEQSFTDENPANFNLSTGYRSMLLKIKALNEIGISKFLDPNKTWTSQDPDAIKAWQKAKDPKISRAIGVRPGNDSPAAYIGKVLKTLDFKTESSQSSTSDGKRERIYSLKESPFEDPIKSSVLGCIAARINAKLAELEVKNFDQILSHFEAQNACTEKVSACTPAASTYIKNAAGVQKSESQESKPDQPKTKLICINGSLQEVAVNYAPTAPLEEAITAIEPSAPNPLQQTSEAIAEPIENAIGSAIKPESLIGKAVRWFSEYAGKFIDQGRIKAIDSVVNGKVTYVTSDGWYPSLDDLLQSDRYQVA
ncbi:hypothetical protein NIES2119_31445 [[Phormidium ambiguum] IAM M-71]|uniref:Replication origin-binding protein domain-containing protein n=1 Tax=[Phormidium ambiguum] IAM M-71 TaxID=454136 RepID=A0A1U7I2C6_9CYAN|nr:plasmid replication protein, CyRepA1 family [Phormidium ambiguum]OKH30186.1 hypothetical protein NIES2119_31445 [Phormidium ambiguum IAM M-71]